MRLSILAVFLAFIIDQATKYYIAFHLLVNERYMEITSFFNLVLVKNTGISFSMFADSEGVSRAILYTGISCIILWLCHWMYKEKDMPTKISLGVIIGGAIGNMSDRITYDGVIDFFDFHIKGYHWPAFNMADSFIFIGAGIMLIQGFRLMKKGQKDA